MVAVFNRGETQNVRAYVMRPLYWRGVLSYSLPRRLYERLRQRSPHRMSSMATHSHDSCCAVAVSLPKRVTRNPASISWLSLGVAASYFFGSSGRCDGEEQEVCKTEEHERQHDISKSHNDHFSRWQI